MDVAIIIAIAFKQLMLGFRQLTLIHADAIVLDLNDQIVIRAL